MVGCPACWAAKQMCGTAHARNAGTAGVQPSRIASGHSRPPPRLGRRSQRGASVTQTQRSKALKQCLTSPRPRSEEHTSELQSREKLVCRPLLEKKKKST